MGQSFTEAIQNNYSPSTTWGGSIQNQNCMYYVQNLLVVNPGANNIGIEYVNSGSCFSATSYFVVGYAAPGTPAGQFNFGIGLISSGGSLSVGPQWNVQSITNGSSTAYVWTLPTNGVPVTLNSFPDGTITQTINAPSSATGGPLQTASFGDVTVTAGEGGSKE